MFRTRLTTVVIATGTIAVLAAPAALAAAPVTYKVTAGRTVKGSVAYKGTTAKGTQAKPTVTFTDTRSSTTVGCTSGTASGTIKLGRRVAAAKMGTVTKTAYTSCTAVGGLVTLTQTQVGTWYLNGSGKTANGVTKVFISNVKAKISSTACSLTLTGSADATYTNSTGKLAVKPRAGSGHKLKASNVSGCSGLITNGDVIAFVGTFRVSTPKGKLSIS